jgi:3-deoxy-7-phosphoheptulonate synthase
MTAVKHLTACGVRIIRGGAYKPRTSPYDFQGLAEGGLELLAEAKAQYGVAVVTEVVGVTHVAKVAAVADMLQIGARNCQNYHLLECVAQAGKPVMLKRGMATTVEEWISAGEYLLVNGCPHVVLCERGIRTFETATRGTLDVGAIAVAKQETHLPVVVDPSHAAGKRSLVLPLALAGVAAGADGIIVEAHPDPVNALSDAAQQWPSDQFSVFMDAVRPLVALMGKKLG